MTRNQHNSEPLCGALPVRWVPLCSTACSVPMGSDLWGASQPSGVMTAWELAYLTPGPLHVLIPVAQMLSSSPWVRTFPPSPTWTRTPSVELPVHVLIPAVSEAINLSLHHFSPGLRALGPNRWQAQPSRHSAGSECQSCLHCGPAWWLWWISAFAMACLVASIGQCSL